MKNRFNHGSGGSSVFQINPFNGVLQNIAAKVIEEDIAKQKKKGSKRQKKGRVQNMNFNGVTKLPKEVVLEIRALSEFAGVSQQQLMKLYAAQYDFTKQYLYQLLNYATRSALVPHKYNLPKEF